ncbi:MAG TPA: hypothetical protein VFH25_04860, partial [Nitrososphaeraceae archaeon]|nr:hypothetical protein [Nitrososphaeraceae archaeon]
MINRKFQNLIELKLLCLSVLIAMFFLAAQLFLLSSQGADAGPCITYDPSTDFITVTCNSATLTDIDNQLNGNTILDKEQSNNGVWLLNAGIVVADKATLYINSTDTTWLKINAD